jgi:hypothetical protein
MTLNICPLGSFLLNGDGFQVLSLHLHACKSCSNRRWFLPVCYILLVPVFFSAPLGNASPLIRRPAVEALVGAYLRCRLVQPWMDDVKLKSESCQSKYCQGLRLLLYESRTYCDLQQRFSLASLGQQPICLGRFELAAFSFREVSSVSLNLDCVVANRRPRLSTNLIPNIFRFSVGHRIRSVISVRGSKRRKPVLETCIYITHQDT